MKNDSQTKLNRRSFFKNSVASVIGTVSVPALYESFAMVGTKKSGFVVSDTWRNYDTNIKSFGETQRKLLIRLSE
jgi:hypothetical protein